MTENSSFLGSDEGQPIEHLDSSRDTNKVFFYISESANANFAKLYPFRCESQDDLSQLNKSTSQNSFEKNNIYP